MDREFMKSFYRRYYDDPQSEAVYESELYKEKRARRYELEEEFEKKLSAIDEELVHLLNDYLDSYVTELEILLEEVFLFGASEREKMLK